MFNVCNVNGNTNVNFRQGGLRWSHLEVNLDIVPGCITQKYVFMPRDVFVAENPVLHGKIRKKLQALLK